MIYSGRLYYNELKQNYTRVLDEDSIKRICSVVIIDNDGNYLQGPDVLDLDDFIQQVKRLKEIPLDPFLKIYDIYNQKQSTKLRDERFGWIQPIICQKPKCYYQDWLKKEIHSRFVELNPNLKDGIIEVSKYKLYSSIRVYFASGEKKNSLLDNYSVCGGAGKTRKPKEKRLGRDPEEEKDWLMNLEDIDKENIKIGYYKFKVKNPKSKNYTAYLDFLNNYYPGCSKYPSEPQFINWGKELNDKTKTKKTTVGESNFNKGEQVRTGSAREYAFGVGSDAQMDTTTDDTHTRSIVFPNTFMGRLTFSMLVDSCSAMPMGLTLVPDSANFNTAIFTLINSATDKKKFVDSLGIPGMQSEDWPVRHLPKKITADCGLLFGPHSDEVPLSLGIEVNNVGAARGDLKSIIERHLGKMLKKIEDLVSDRGLVNKPNNSPRTTTDPKKLAILNYKELLKLIVTEILYWIKYEPIEDYPTPIEMQNQDILPTSLNIWNFHRDQGNEALIEIDPAEIMIKLLPKKLKKYGKLGISFFGKKWKCVTEDGLKVYKNLVYGGDGPKKLAIAFSKVDTENVYWVYNDKYYPIKPIHKPFDLMTFYEVEIKKERELTLKRINDAEKLDAALKKRKHQLQTISEAEKRAKVLGKPKMNDAPAAKKADMEHFYNSDPNYSLKNKGDGPAPEEQTIDSQSLSLPDFLNMN